MAMWNSPPDDRHSSPPLASAPPRLSSPELSEDPILVESPVLPEASLPAMLSPPLQMHLLTPSSVPCSPQLAHRSASGGKLREGFKRMFVRPPLSHSNLDRSNPNSAEDPYHHSDGTPVPKPRRYYRLRPFRRIKRRSDKIQYHSDDGYTSDPGPPLHDDPLPSIDMDEDEETDGADSSEGHGQGAESRTERQKKELEKKLQKTRQQLLQEKEHIQVAQNSYLQGLETTQSGKAQQRIKSRYQRDHDKSHAAIEQNRKKIEKYQREIVLLQEGGAKEGLRGKIEEGLKAQLIGIKKGFNYAGNRLKKGKRYIIRTRSSQGGDLGDGELEVEDGKFAVMIEEEEEEGAEEESYDESGIVRVSKTALDELQEQQEEMKRQLENKESRVNTLEEMISEVLSKLGQVQDTYERLQDQVNDVLDLHQNAVGELRGQVGQVESMTVTKTQDLEDVVDEYQSKVEKLDALVHLEIERKAEVERARNCMMKVVARVVTFALHAVAIILKLISVLSTKTGAGAVLIVVMAILFYAMMSSYWTDNSS